MASSPSKKNFFFPVLLFPLSSFLQGTPKGRVVILPMILWVNSIERPFTTIVAWFLVSGMREREKSLATSSSYPPQFLKETYLIIPCEYL